MNYLHEIDNLSEAEVHESHYLRISSLRTNAAAGLLVLPQGGPGVDITAANGSSVSSEGSEYEFLRPNEG